MVVVLHVDLAVGVWAHESAIPSMVSTFSGQLLDLIPIHLGDHSGFRRVWAQPGSRRRRHRRPSPDRARAGPCGSLSEVTLHEMLVHMIVETERHLGQADILRESIDSSVGYYPANDNLPR